MDFRQFQALKMNNLFEGLSVFLQPQVRESSSDSETRLVYGPQPHLIKPIYGIQDRKRYDGRSESPR